MIKISAVSYLNTYPFVYGIRESGAIQDAVLNLEVPSVCARNFMEDKADIALVPAGALPEIGATSLLSEFCIGATGPVKTVLLLSTVPLQEIKTIFLDFDSRTSVRLVKVLAANFWKISPEWVGLEPGQAQERKTLESVVAIGDKTFALRDRYPYVYDLAEEWIRFTSLPFVFAVWIRKDNIPRNFLNAFCKALEFGVNRKAESINYFRNQLPPDVDCLDYLEHNISFTFDRDKQKGLELFLNYLKEL